MSKPLSSLPPAVEHRLSGWEQIQHRLAMEPGPRLRPTITISRRFGCEAFPLSERLKPLLEEASGEPWNIYDRSLIEKVAAAEGISLAILRRLGEMSSVLAAFGLQEASSAVHEKAFGETAKYVVQIATVGNAIIVGRGAALLCRNMKNCFHFRLEASHDWRVASMAKRLELSRKEADELVQNGAKQRERFINQALGGDINDPMRFDAIFNNERHTTGEMAAAIVAYVRSAWPDRTYFKK